MGAKHSVVFDKEQLQNYAECSYFTRTEIRKLYDKFTSASPRSFRSHEADVVTRIPPATLIRKTQVLRACPFALRMCEVFSTDRLQFKINFPDFLDMMSAYSDRAPWHLKAAYAFKIFDMDEDSYIGFADIECAIDILTGGEGLDDTEISDIVTQVLTEADTAREGYINYMEFEHMLARAPDFTKLFRLSIL